MRVECRLDNTEVNNFVNHVFLRYEQYSENDQFCFFVNLKF